MNFTFATADLIDKLPDLPSCEINFKCYGKKSKFFGKIRTVQCFRDNGLVKQVLQTPFPGGVLVVDGGGSYASALMGDLIARMAIDHGWAGVIVYGVIRDSAVINTMDFGIKALGTNPRKSAKTGKGQVDVPVEFGNVIFSPGDYLYSDEDGILVASQSLV
ncbi:MAG: ribonuclease E activity regulator RraA [Neisseriaceae bacterium]